MLHRAAQDRARSAHGPEVLPTRVALRRSMAAALLVAHALDAELLAAGQLHAGCMQARAGGPPGSRRACFAAAGRAAAAGMSTCMRSPSMATPTAARAGGGCAPAKSAWLLDAPARRASPPRASARTLRRPVHSCPGHAHSPSSLAYGQAHPAGPRTCEGHRAPRGRLGQRRPALYGPGLVCGACLCLAGKGHDRARWLQHHRLARSIQCAGYGQGLTPEAQQPARRQPRLACAPERERRAHHQACMPSRSVTQAALVQRPGITGRARS